MRLSTKCHHGRGMREHQMMTERGQFTPPCFDWILWFTSIDTRNLQEPQTRNQILWIRISHGRKQKHEARRDGITSSTNTNANTNTNTRGKLYITETITPTIVFKVEPHCQRRGPLAIQAAIHVGVLDVFGVFVRVVVVLVMIRHTSGSRVASGVPKT